MKVYNFILLIVLLLISFSSNAQQNLDNLIIRSHGGKGKTYLYQKKTYSKDQIYKVIVQDAEAIKLYNKYQTKKENSKIGYYVSGGLAIMSVGFLGQAFNEKYEPEIAKALATSLLSGGGSIIVLSISAINASAGKKIFSKSIKTFNENVQNPKHLGQVPLELHLQPTMNGIGLILNF